MNDLFGREIAEPAKNPVKGYAHPPGTGPAGESCATCEFIRRIRHNDKTYLKCFQNAHNWTRGPGSDIRARSPACSLWQKAQAATEADRRPD